MADTPNAARQETGKVKKIVPMALLIAAGVVIGGASGALVAGPLLAKRAAAPAVAAPADLAATPAPVSSAPGVLYAVDNLVLNPAGSNGTRFLLANLAFDLDGEATKSQVAQRDAQVRDALLRVLAAKTVEELVDPAGRDSLKTELRDAVAQLFGAGAVRQVFLSQFVIQ